MRKLAKSTPVLGEPQGPRHLKGYAHPGPARPDLKPDYYVYNPAMAESLFAARPLHQGDDRRSKKGQQGLLRRNRRRLPSRSRVDIRPIIRIHSRKMRQDRYDRTGCPVGPLRGNANPFWAALFGAGNLNGSEFTLGYSLQRALLARVPRPLSPYVFFPWFYGPLDGPAIRPCKLADVGFPDVIYRAHGGQPPGFPWRSGQPQVCSWRCLLSGLFIGGWLTKVDALMRSCPCPWRCLSLPVPSNLAPLDPTAKWGLLTNAALDSGGISRAFLG